jgi:hypothetical protein
MRPPPCVFTPFS